jgi:hypothetical protein
MPGHMAAWVLGPTRLPGLDDEGGRHHLRPSNRIPARRIDVFFLHSGRIDWRLHQRFDLQARLNDLPEKRAESATVRHDRNTLPRGVFAGAFGEVRCRDSVLRSVPDDAAMPRVSPERR